MPFKSAFSDFTKSRLVKRVDSHKRRGQTTRQACASAGISESMYYAWRKRLSETKEQDGRLTKDQDARLTAKEREQIESMIFGEDRDGDVIDVEMHDGHETFRREPNEERPAGEDRETVRESYVKALEATNAEQHAGILGLQAERDTLLDFAVNVHVRHCAIQTHLIMLMTGKMSRKELFRELLKGWFASVKDELSAGVYVDNLMSFIMGDNSDAH